jgi:hypothetical protein
LTLTERDGRIIAMTTTEITEYDCATAELTVGMTLPNGETVIALRKLGEYRLCEDGGYNHHSWKAVMVRGGKNFHDYSVRTVYALPHGWSVGGGEYYHHISDALVSIGWDWATDNDEGNYK